MKTLEERKKIAEEFVKNIKLSPRKIDFMNAKVWVGGDIVRIYINNEIKFGPSRYGPTYDMDKNGKVKRSKRFLYVDEKGKICGRGAKNYVRWAEIGKEEKPGLIEMARKEFDQEKWDAIREEARNDKIENLVDEAINRERNEVALARTKLKQAGIDWENPQEG